jgi:hypothetical protein
MALLFGDRGAILLSEHLAVRKHSYDKPLIRQLNHLSEKRRSFKRGLWGSCVATLMARKAILLSRRDAAPPASFHLNVAKDRF